MMDLWCNKLWIYSVFSNFAFKSANHNIEWGFLNIMARAEIVKKAISLILS